MKDGRLEIKVYGVRQLHCCDVRFKGTGFKKLREDLRIEVQTNLDEIVMELVKSASIQSQRRKHIEELQKEIDNLLEVASKGGEVAEVIYTKIEAKQQEINEIELGLFLNTRITDRLHIDYSIPINYSRFTDEQKKSICLLLIDEICLHENGDMEIAWKI